MRAKLAFAGLCNRSGHDGETIVENVQQASAIVDGRPVVNFASASYLSLPVGIPASTRLSLSLPRALAVDRSTLDLERELACLVEQPAALVGASTLHILTDVARVLAGPSGAILLDRGCYSLAVSAAATAKATGTFIGSFEHFDAKSLERALAASSRGPRVVICDGISMPGDIGPLDELVEVCERANAVFVIDDTQGIGLLGATHAREPYGTDGRGTAQYRGVRSDRVVIVASLAKALGVPIAFVAATKALVSQVRAGAEFVSASSPPDLATVRAALQALHENARSGDARRRDLAQAVRDLIAEAGTTGCGLFPVQSWYFKSQVRAARAHATLLEAGIWTVLVPQATENPTRAAIRFVVTAAHAGPTMARALEAIRAVRRKVTAW